MALPPRFLEELNNKLSLAHIVGKKVKLTKRGHEYTGLCPFHGEKTPSFTVSEDKAFYHCFGCGAHGDAISFVMNTEKLSFPEALEQLAHSVGMQVPKATPEQAALQKKQASLYDIMEKACAFYQKQLFSAAGKHALEYLKIRRLDPKTVETFRLGYAPSGNSLRAHLLREGINERDLIDLGLVCKSTDPGRDNYDYFRDRVLFPIQNHRGNIIGFGGRVMGDGEPKYLNSPETPLFHKGENLYGLYTANDAILKSEKVILVEGYMDVIALHKAGVKNVVAPLGTALTETQIGLLWKKSNEPIICFDGDNAGRRAAARAMERALPILTPGHSLQFVWLPEGVDPDDFVNAFGTDAFYNLLGQSKPLATFVWEQLTLGKMFDTPEKMALLEKEGKDQAAKIKDPSVRSYYEKELQKQLKDFSYTQFKRGKKSSTPTRRSMPLPDLTPQQSEIKMLLSYIVFYPEIGIAFLEKISTLPHENKKIARLLEILTNEMSENIPFTRESLHMLLEQKYSKNVFIYLQSELEMLERADKPLDDAKKDMHTRLTALHIEVISKDINMLMGEFSANPTPELWTQILSLKQEKEKLTEKME